MSISVWLSEDADARPIWPLAVGALKAWREAAPAATAAWLDATGFEAKHGEVSLVPDGEGGLAGVALGLGNGDGDGKGDAKGNGAGAWAFGDLAHRLPAGRYRIDGDLDAAGLGRAALEWALGAYRFDRYRQAEEPRARLALPDGFERTAIAAQVEGICLARDLINTPADHMGPSELAGAAEDLAKAHGARFSCLIGEQLLEQNYPAIHAVGRASDDPPRLIDLVWGDEGAPKLTLVGKGVCFDTGGLDLKSAAGMAKMKKDMGGAAGVLGLAKALMLAGLPLRLRVLVPAVENAVAGNAYRPGDVIATRKGLSVEVGNTDAEGRIVLCDALAEADGEGPDWLIDMATLTGAARVALGPDLPALFSNDDDLADAILRHGLAAHDPLWRMPLYAPYDELLKSTVADLNNISNGPFAGAVTAALYLQRFVGANTAWAHIDTYGWNENARPGRPAGGEGLALRALFAAVRERFAGAG